jgi:hypothetical protein
MNKVTSDIMKFGDIDIAASLVFYSRKYVFGFVNLR